MKIGGIIVAIIAVIGLIVFFSTSSEEQVDVAQNSKSLSYSTILEEVDAGESVVLDVRTPQEYVTGHTVDAVNLSLQDIQAGQSPEVDTDTKLYVYCRSGNRSAQATRLLEEQGYDVVDLGGVSDVTAIGAQLVQ